MRNFIHNWPVVFVWIVTNIIHTVIYINIYLNYETAFMIIYYYILFNTFIIFLVFFFHKIVLCLSFPVRFRQEGVYDSYWLKITLFLLLHFEPVPRHEHQFCWALSMVVWWLLEARAELDAPYVYNFSRNRIINIDFL